MRVDSGCGVEGSAANLSQETVGFFDSLRSLRMTNVSQSSGFTLNYSSIFGKAVVYWVGNICRAERVG